MARIARKNQKIFAENASNNGVFGSLQANDPTHSNDPDVIQGRTAYSNGWNDATYSSELLPPLEEFQALQYLFSRQLSYIFQEGISEWNSSTTYYKGSIAKAISGTIVRLYISIVDNNTNNLVTDTTRWTCFFDSSLGYADIGLTNLNSTGKNIGNWSTNITNCITEIPQDINLELSSGTLTLKAGSKVYMPNGSGVFDVVTNSNDLTYTLTANGEHLICVAHNASAITSRPVSSCTSGAGATAVSGFAYNTTTNKINNYSGTGTIGGQYTFPIAVVTVSNGAISSIDQVFNGFGYIGSTVFALPGVKGLIPNGRNSDGTLRSALFTVNSLLITTDISSATGGLEYYVNGSGVYRVNFGVNTYNPITNYITNSSGIIQSSVLIDQNAYRTGGKVTSFNPKPAFRSVDYYDAVRTTGDQTIAGVKTHTDDITIEKSGTGGRYNVKNTSLDLTNTSRTSNIGVGLRFFDKNDNIAGEAASYYDTSGNSRTQIQARNRASGSEVSASISINVDKNGNVSTYAPTPATNDNSTKIATTAFVNNLKSTIVGWGVPDYSAGVAITSPYTPTKDGIIIAKSTSSYSTAEIAKGTMIISRANCADATSGTNVVWAIVKSGEEYTVTAGGTATLLFVPFIGG